MLKTVRTYMDFSKALDPAHIVTIPDLELSVALGSTLVTFDKERQLVAGLASKWAFPSEKELSFSLRPGIRWSDGAPITAEEFRRALLRAKNTYPEDLQALFSAVDLIEARDSKTLVFRTKGPAVASGILLKLSEPMYALVSLKNGHLDLSRSAGPFILRDKAADTVILERNSNWHGFHVNMPERVEIRKPRPGEDVIKAFATDPWPNLASGTSLLESNLLDSMRKAGFVSWQRSMDTVFGLFPSKKFLESGGNKVVQALGHKLSAQAILPGFSGFVPAEQFFPRGYELWSSKEPAVPTPETLPGRPVRIVLANSTYAKNLKPGLLAALERATGSAPLIELISFQDIDERMKRGDYDLFASGIAVADANYDGAMSFFIERDPAIIQSLSGALDFRSQVKKARGAPLAKDRAAMMREIVLKAQEAGHLLPLFHFSGIAIAKPGIDLSEVPNTDEAVMFSKIRMQ